MRTVGICIGASTIQWVQVRGDQEVLAVEEAVRIPHGGNPREAFLRLVGDLDFVTIDRIAVTGRSFRNSVNLTAISEPEAVEQALAREYREGGSPDVVVSAGGETQLVYRVGSAGGIVSVHTGNKCASGTGEFFLQQIRRMGLSLGEAVSLAEQGTPYRIAGRCSVFCKSDCTHALNKGACRADIVAGLCTMIVEKIGGLIKGMPCDRVAVIGGGALNRAMVGILREQVGQLDVPEQAAVFEAYGAALWALEHPCVAPPEDPEKLFRDSNRRSFQVHAPLAEARSLVEYKQGVGDTSREGDECILGLDVGSTTTKAALVRRRDSAMLASVYLRTNGDPVGASRSCYRSIRDQVAGVDVSIVGLGVTGSGRQIAGLHALSETVINEIIAHATAAAHFDPEVDTIFEIGGQDAKYTLLTGGVPSDYAMNEACSAGTGSFLEESAWESLNVKMEDIAELAVQGASPPNFRDECAAFISSDIKLAGQEGIGRNDILAGLVYSICMNYLNRVKGARPVGKKVFMQGGVCYNGAVPIAMAALMKTPIVVPPDPGLMGAYGVALEVDRRLEAGSASPARFDLDELVARKAVNEGSFVCRGGKEKCDRKCEIARVRIAGKVYPFGGICDRYYNLRLHKDIAAGELDLVAERQRLLERFSDIGADPYTDAGFPFQRTVGLNRSFLSHSLLPLFSSFFSRLGFRVLYPDSVAGPGLSRIEAQYCLPAQLAHGAFLNLLEQKPDYIFLPHIMQLPVPNVPTFSRTCVFVQGEPYYLRTTFREELESSPTALLTPILMLEQGYERAEQTMVDMAAQMGVDRELACEAYRHACARQREFEQSLKERGRRALEQLAQTPERWGVVLFGRPYNAFAPEANMGVAHKVASRGFTIIPHDMLPADQYPVDRKMFWAMGQKIMKAARFVKEHDSLFGFYITSFSCGPDSFLLGYFRTLMDAKPSLTLELDQHTASAGIDTRVEAALDIMDSWRRMGGGKRETQRRHYRPARVILEDQVKAVSSDGGTYPLTDSRVEVALPSMGQFSAPGLAAVLRGEGIAAKVLPVADKDVLLEARKNASCKECLPYLVLLGSLLTYLKQPRHPDTVTLFFMPTGGGPCRLGQYCRALEQVIHRHRLRNVAVLTVTDENGYAGMGKGALLRAWKSIVAADVFEDIRNMVKVAAKHPAAAAKEVDACWRELLSYFEGRLTVRFGALLSMVSKRLARIPLARDPRGVPVVSLVGEYYVRKDVFSRMNLVEYLQAEGFMVKVAPAMEYMMYGNRNISAGLQEGDISNQDRLAVRVRAYIFEWWERRIKRALSGSRVYHYETVDIERTIGGVAHILDHNFRGETILTVGSGLREILDHSCGVIAIGPFGCMPSRMAEAMLRREMNVAGKRRIPGWKERVEPFNDLENFPFLSIETDGSAFPQIIVANLEAFVLQARRVHQRLMKLRRRSSSRRRKGAPMKSFRDMLVRAGASLKQFTW